MRKRFRLPEREAEALQFLPDDRRLMVAEHDRVGIWDAERWKLVRELSAPDLRLAGAAVDPAGRLLAALTSDRPPLLYVWDLGSGRLLTKQSVAGAWAWDVTFSPDGRYLAAAADPTHVWHTNALVAAG